MAGELGQDHLERDRRLYHQTACTGEGSYPSLENYQYNSCLHSVSLSHGFLETVVMFLAKFPNSLEEIEKIDRSIHLTSKTFSGLRVGDPR